MKKIKSIKQLQAEKKRIKQQQQYLENKIQVKWDELKERLTPASIVKDTFSSVIKNKTAENLNGESILKSTFTYGVTLLANRFAEKARDKFGKIFHK